MNNYYILKSHYPDYKGKIRNIYYYVSLKYDKYDKEYILNVGNPKKSQCLTIIINNSSTAIIQNVSFDKTKKCTLLHKKYSEGIIKNLVKCSLLLSISLFKHLKYFSLTDNSIIECGVEKIALSDYYFVKYGKSWYQYNFDAKPENKREIHNKTNIFRRLMKKKLSKSFIKDYMKYYSKYYNNVDEMVEIISKYSNSKYTYGEFITNLMNDKDDCAIYSYIFTKIFGKVLYGTEWIINKSSIIKYDNDIYYIMKQINQIKNNKKIKNFIKSVNYINMMNKHVWSQNGPHFKTEKETD